MNDRNKTGFTLIELLVVIAIISILAAILFPVFASAREKARQTACLSNLKQLGLGMMQYQQDYDEYNPPGANWSSPGGNGWAGQIYPYVKSTQVYVCPDDSTVQAQCSYSYNSNAVVPTGTSVSALSISKYNAPSQTILLSEVQGNSQSGTVWSISNPATTTNSDSYVGGGSGGYSAAGYGLFINGLGYFSSPPTLKYATGYVQNSGTIEYYSQPAYFYYAAAAGRHSGGANYVMADCHAKFFLPGAVSAGVNNPTANDCGGTATAASGWYVPAAATSCGGSTIAATYSVQ